MTYMHYSFSRMEILDDQFAGLEYAREQCELLAQEACSLLRGYMMIAGDYNAVFGGMYGHVDISSQPANQELVSLLKQLIGLLESGQPFMLSSDLLNMMQGGDMHIHTGPAAPMQSAVVQPVQLAPQPTRPQQSNVKYVKTAAYADENMPNVRYRFLCESIINCLIGVIG